MMKKNICYTIFAFLLVSCSFNKEINTNELHEIKQKDPILLHRINGVKGEFLVNYINCFKYQIIFIGETRNRYNTVFNKFKKYEDVKKLNNGIAYEDVVQKLGVPIIIKDDSYEKQIVYFQRRFSLRKGFYLSSYLIVLNFKNNFLDYSREEYFFRP